MADINAPSSDRWTTRARPSLLYVLDAMLLWTIPVGLLGAFNPPMAQGMVAAMTAYLGGLPQSFYALFATAYLGYTAARQWGKARGSDR